MTDFKVDKTKQLDFVKVDTKKIGTRLDDLKQRLSSRIIGQKIAKYIVEPVCAGIESVQIKKFNRIIAHYSYDRKETELFTKSLLIVKK